jgi:Glycosyltransferase family 87
MVSLFGGPTQNDAVESLYATWALAHGKVACVYPPASPVPASRYFLFYQPHPAPPPLWPLISGGIAALTRIGHTAAFPSQYALGTSCVDGYSGMYKWAQNSAAIFPTIGLGYWSWFVLLAGVVALLRASGRGRTGWEAFGVVSVALLPLVWMPLLDQFHPQDLVALGLSLAGMACARRRKWVWAGVLVGLAVTSQQFALLVLAPLFVVAPGRQRWKFLVSSAAVVALVSLPFVVATSGRAIHAVLFGTGDSITFGGTFLWESGLRGSALVFCSRILPILVSLAIAWWALRRLGSRVLEPIPLISLLATSLSLRLVFEEGLFGYKFLALGVMLLLLAIVRGQIRGRLVGWLALASLAFNPIPPALAINGRPWGDHVGSILPMACLVVVLVLIVYDAAHRRVRWYLIAWFVIAACAFLQWPLWSPDSIRAVLPIWLWQLVLLPTGVVMAGSPLVNSIRTAGRKPPASPENNGTLSSSPVTQQPDN